MVTELVDRGRTDDRPLDQLDDESDREELRSRYYGLLQELRVVLPGVQVLLAFLLTVPFSSRFDELDDAGRSLFTVALVSAALSVVCLLTPTVLHRLGERTARRQRLQWGIRCTIVGIGALAVATAAGLLCVARMVHAPGTALLLTAVVVLAIVLLWVVLPRTLTNRP